MKRKNYSVYMLYTYDPIYSNYVVAKTKDEAKQFFAKKYGITGQEIYVTKYSLKELCGIPNDDGVVEVKTFQEILGEDYEYNGPELLTWR